MKIIRRKNKSANIKCYYPLPEHAPCPRYGL